MSVAARRLPRNERYSDGAILFHWTIAALVIFNLVVGLAHVQFKALGGLMGVHKSVGLTVLALTLGRIAWRLAHRPPPLPADVTRWERGAAHAAHWGLYLLLLLLPLSGWAMDSNGDANLPPLRWFGVPVPLLPVSRGGADAAYAAHLKLGWAMTVLVAVHVAAALRHHFIRRDAVLARMAPALATPEPR